MANNELGQHWSKDESNNDSVSPNGAPEGWLGAHVNNTVRENMAVVRTWYDDPEWLSILYDASPRGDKTLTYIDPSSFRIEGFLDVADPYFKVGRRIKMFGATTEEAFILSATPSGSDTVITITGTNVPTGLVVNGVQVYFAKSIHESAFTAAVAIGDVKMVSGPVRQAEGAGWLPCDGAEYPVATYPALAALYGSTGNQNGAYDDNPAEGAPQNDYFRVPDMRGRVPIGYWDALDTQKEPDGDYDNYPDAGGSDKTKTFYGEKDHEITEDELAAHDHGGTTGTDAHSHDIQYRTQTGAGTVAASTRAASDGTTSGIVESDSHDHTIASAGDAVNNRLDLRQASVVMGYVVYAGV